MLTEKTHVPWQEPAARQLFTALDHDQEMTKADPNESAAHLAASAGTVHVTVLNGTGTSLIVLASDFVTSYA
jgi:hypothetical protein